MFANKQNKLKHMDSASFRLRGRQMIDFVADLMDGLRDRPVLPAVSPGYLRPLLPAEAPQDPESWEDLMQDVERLILPGVTFWHSPHFHAYFPTANSYPAILGDILSSAIACIGFSWISSPACTELEMTMMDWLGKMLRLPDHFLFSSDGTGGGIIQGTASEATFVALLAAKHKAGDKVEKLVGYASCQSHSSVERAGLLGGVKICLLETDDRLRLRGDTLREAVRRDRAAGLVPFFVCATLGTTNTCAFDHLVEIGRVCQDEGLWLHVDAAYAGSAFICPEFRHLLDGIEYADSFNFNPHKWLLVNFDCSAMWVKNSRELSEAFMVNPVYLRHQHQGEIPDYRHWQIPLGRRFRSLKLWFVCRLYGVHGMQEHIRKQVAQARDFQKMVETDSRFEVVYPSSLGLVCFRLKGTNELNAELLKKINDRRHIYLVNTEVRGKFILRFAVCSRLTEAADISYAWQEIQEVATALLAAQD